MLAAPGTALDPRRAIGQYLQSAWATDAGLPQTSVYSITRTTDGYLLVGTERGWPVSMGCALRFSIGGTTRVCRRTDLYRMKNRWQSGNARRAGSGKMNWDTRPARISSRPRTGAYDGGSRLAPAVPEAQLALDAVFFRKPFWRRPLFPPLLSGC